MVTCLACLNLLNQRNERCAWIIPVALFTILIMGFERDGQTLVSV